MATANYRGWEAFYDWDKKDWFYADNKKLVDLERPCKKCGERPTPEGHDACLGTLLGVKFACCGHGNKRDRYFIREEE